MADNELNLPSLPTLTWDGYCWTAQITLSAWAGFRLPHDLYDIIDNPEPSDGTVKLSVFGPMFPFTEDKSPPSTEQIATYQYLTENQIAIRDVILHAFFANYPEWKEEFSEFFSSEETEVFLPQLESPEQLRKLISLSHIFIHDASKDGFAYVGYSFQCTWEEEHGLGAMTHTNRIIMIGATDITMLPWVYKEDMKQQ